MSKYKPFLIGSLLGAGTMFVALQFHLVQSTEGFRLVPRTPQPSLGLAYADIRTWTAEHWTDRPELARALVAHGSTDLVATSVSNGLLDSISAEGSALDKLRGLMNEASDGTSADSLFDSPGRLSIPDEAAPKSDFDDLFSIPFPQDARKTNSAPAVTSTPSSANSRVQNSGSGFAETTPNAPSLDDFGRSSSTSVARRELPSIEDILGGESRDLRTPGDRSSATQAPSTSNDFRSTQAPSTSNDFRSTQTPSTSNDFRSTQTPSTSNDFRSTQAPSTSNDFRSTQAPSTSSDFRSTQTPSTSNDFRSVPATAAQPKSWAERAREALSPRSVESETNAMESLLFGEDAQRPPASTTGLNDGSSAAVDRPTSGFQQTEGTRPAVANRSPFADDTPGSGSTTSSAPRSDAEPGMFQDITSSVQQRTQNVFDNARTGLQKETTNAFGDAATSFNRFVQERVQQTLPESVSSMFREDSAAVSAESQPLPPALKAIQDGFDPFVE